MAKISSAQKTKVAFLAFTITACTVIGLSNAFAGVGIKVMREDVVCGYEVVGGEVHTKKVMTLSILESDVPRRQKAQQALIDANKRVNACAEFFNEAGLKHNPDGSKNPKTTVNGTIIDIVKE
jgi:hypothetical protein